MPPLPVADLAPLDRPIEGKWQVTDLLAVNGNKVRHRVMVDAEARFHTHRGSDEYFLVLTGEVTIDTRAGGEAGTVTSYTLRPGQMFAVPPGTEHRARCTGRATLVVIDDIERLG